MFLPELTILQAYWGNLSHRGVFADKRSVSKGTRFGPFQGKLVNTSEIKTYDDNTLMWEVILRRLLLQAWKSLRLLLNSRVHFSAVRCSKTAS